METKNKEKTALDRELLELFKEFLEKQDLVQRQTTKPFIHHYSHTELHVIDAIGKYRDMNVSGLAARLAITRGAACKIAKKLVARGDIASYRRDDNRKEIYYTLTGHGKKAFLAHQQRHEHWVNTDLRFFQTVSLDEKRIVARFLESYNAYMKGQLEAAE